MTSVPAIAGVVLAGGASSRFGRDKAEEIWRGRTLLDWSIAALDPLCEIVFVSGREHPDRESVTDRPRPGLGPLGGLAGALSAAHERGYERLLSLPCDTPQLPKGLLDRLAEQKAAFAADCPVIGIWPTAKASRLIAWLDRHGAGAMHAWAAGIGARAIETPFPIGNINSIKDLEQLDARRDPSG
ncbi:molybdenum cofactor guanylyltransferase [Sphingopyxis sp.]|uniref:molybdenum cofactor guanylyltransferase n=1 Tax=Sphingopyxis sp. TaxID=1908224 RepID=UPI0035B33DE9